MHLHPRFSWKCNRWGSLLCCVQAPKWDVTQMRLSDSHEIPYNDRFHTKRVRTNTINGQHLWKWTSHWSTSNSITRATLWTSIAVKLKWWTKKQIILISDWAILIPLTWLKTRVTIMIPWQSRNNQVLLSTPSTSWWNLNLKWWVHLASMYYITWRHHII